MGDRSTNRTGFPIGKEQTGGDRSTNRSLQVVVSRLFHLHAGSSYSETF